MNPGKHDRQLMLPVVEAYRPVVQVEQILVESFTPYKSYCPRGQAEQITDPACELFPNEHVGHSDAAEGSDWKRPAGQGKHLEDNKNVPNGHVELQLRENAA